MVKKVRGLFSLIVSGPTKAASPQLVPRASSLCFRCPVYTRVPWPSIPSSILSSTSSQYLLFLNSDLPYHPITMFLTLGSATDVFPLDAQGQQPDLGSVGEGGNLRFPWVSKYLSGGENGFQLGPSWCSKCGYHTYPNTVLFRHLAVVSECVWTRVTMKTDENFSKISTTFSQHRVFVPAFLKGHPLFFQFLVIRFFSSIRIPLPISLFLIFVFFF